MIKIDESIWIENTSEPCPTLIHPIAATIQPAKKIKQISSFSVADAAPCSIAAKYVSVLTGKIISPRVSFIGVSRDSSSFKSRIASTRAAAITPSRSSKSIYKSNGCNRMLRSRIIWRIGWRVLILKWQSASECFVVSFAQMASSGLKMSSRSMLYGR